MEKDQKQKKCWKTLSVNEPCYLKLSTLAKRDRRPLCTQLEIILEEEYKRRRIKVPTERAMG